MYFRQQRLVSSLSFKLILSGVMHLGAPQREVAINLHIQYTGGFINNGRGGRGAKDSRGGGHKIPLQF